MEAAMEQAAERPVVKARCTPDPKKGSMKAVYRASEHLQLKSRLCLRTSCITDHPEVRTALDRSCVAVVTG